MTVVADSLFLSHPDPMWIFDLQTLRFLAVNTAAIAKYGYSREEFLAMTIADIRHAEDIPAMQQSVATTADGLDVAGVWRHRLKSGEDIYVDVTGHTIDYDGKRAELIAARDVSRLVIAEQTAHEALARAKAAHQSSDRLARQFQIMFDSVPGKFIVFSPDGFDIVAVSDAYLAATGATRAETVGRNLFDALPLQPDDVTHAKLRDSFNRVVTTGKPDLLEVQRFLVLRPDGAPGGEDRYWAMSNTPVTGPDGRLLHLMLRMQDVTDAINAARSESAEGGTPNVGRHNFDLIAHTRELKTDNLRLTELATRLRTTQRLLDTGTWEYVVSEDRLIWSANVYDMYGVKPEDFGHGFADYIALVHPDHRGPMRAHFDVFMATGDTHYTFAHKVSHPDGRIVHLHGVGEKTETPKGAVISGVVQNVTESVESAQALTQAKRMLEIAGTSAKFGAWRYDVRTERLEWSPQMARIHDEPDGYLPNVADCMAYYAPEYRDHATALFQSCLLRGEPFAEVLEMISATGRRLWVRAIGEAEQDADGRIVAINGALQDITELVEVRKRAEDSELLLKIAGRSVRLGGWRVSLPDRKVSWTDGVAVIHDLPPGTTPNFDGGIDYFAPEDQEDARKVFEACAIEGVPFDNVRDVITAKGNRRRVRSLGQPVHDSMGKIIAVQGAMQDISELTAAQQKADDLSIRLAETLENIGDAFMTIDRDWRFTYLNSRAETFLKRSRDSLIGRKVFDEFPEAVGTAFEINYNRALETGETVRFEQFFVPLARTFRIHAHPSRSGLAVYFADITEDRRRDEQLRLLDAAVARINDIVVITSADNVDSPENSRIVYVNNAFERRTGFTREEAIGQTPCITRGPDTQLSELHRIRNALSTFTPVRAELINYTKSGQEYWVEIDIVPIANLAGTYTHFVSIQRDITERRRAEEALRISEERFRLIAKSTRNAVWEWDIVGGHQWWSDELVEIFGHHPRIDGEKPTVWRANVHPDDKHIVDEAMARLLSGQADAVHDRYRFRRADGSWTTVEDRAFAIRDETGQAVRILGSMTDISEQLHLEDRLRQSQKIEAVGQLTGGVAHDFNNLLTIIMGNTELLQDNLEEGNPLRSYADMCARAADRAAELTNRLLAFSRKQALQPRVMNVNAAITGIEGMLRRTLGENIEIEIFQAADLWQAEVDLGQLEATLLNLAINSRDAMPNGGALTIETANASLDEDYVSGEPGLKPGHYVVIAVSDTGDGIPHDQIDRVFEPFFTTKAVGKGTGLGLSMAYGFVKQTGGHIRIYSEANEGTTVKLFFPRFAGETMVPGRAGGNSRVLHGQETILVLEDDRLILQQLTAQLLALGYNVLTASEGEAALAILRERSEIDLLLSDIVLPGGMNGRQVADAALAIRPDLKVLFSSGYSENAIVHHGRLDPGVELLSKPYRRSELVAKIRKVLKS